LFGGVFFSAKLIVGKGARWKIENGFDIPIVSEPWLGAGSSIPPVSQAAMSLRGYTVGNLMQQNSKSWNEEIVRHIFTEETTQMVLNIPLFPQVTEDNLVWNPEKNGHYSVKSVYR
jgi:hypothetical protein